jgi:hypothetical protein
MNITIQSVNIYISFNSLKCLVSIVIRHYGTGQISERGRMEAKSWQTSRADREITKFAESYTCSRYPSWQTTLKLIHSDRNLLSSISLCTLEWWLNEASIEIRVDKRSHCTTTKRWRKFPGLNLYKESFFFKEVLIVHISFFTIETSAKKKESPFRENVTFTGKSSVGINMMAMTACLDEKFIMRNCNEGNGIEIFSYVRAKSGGTYNSRPSRSCHSSGDLRQR